MERAGQVTPIIQCKDLCKNFTTKNTSLDVLENLNIDVEENEFVVLLGPGQCGKTTLMNIIAGIQPPPPGRCSSRVPPSPAQTRSWV